jgi:hypothetical protein
MDALPNCAMHLLPERLNAPQFMKLIRNLSHMFNLPFYQGLASADFALSAALEAPAIEAIQNFDTEFPRNQPPGALAALLQLLGLLMRFDPDPSKLELQLTEWTEASSGSNCVLTPLCVLRFKMLSEDGSDNGGSRELPWKDWG